MLHLEAQMPKWWALKNQYMTFSKGLGGFANLSMTSQNASKTRT
jgi:hypothetical protein